MSYKCHLRFLPETPCAVFHRERIAAVVAIIVNNLEMKRRCIDGKVIEDSREGKSVIVQARITPSEFETIRLMMQNHGYHSVSSLIRDMVLHKKVVNHREVVKVTDRVLRDKLNMAVYNLNKIGQNYNQIVALYQRQAKEFLPSGMPYLDTFRTEKKMSDLMKLTQSLRDEVSIMIDLFIKYNSNT